MTYKNILLNSSILDNASLSAICTECKKHPDRAFKKMKEYLKNSLENYGPVTRDNNKNIYNVANKCLTAATQAAEKNENLVDKKAIFEIDESNHSDDSDCSMMSTDSNFMGTRSNPRGRPRSITPNKRGRGRPRSNSGSLTRSSSSHSLQENNSYEIRSHGNAIAADFLASIEHLKADRYSNKKKHYKSWWFLLFIHAAERGVSPASLVSIMELLQEVQPILDSMEIPSVSLLKQYKLSVPFLNEVLIKNFLSKHDRYCICFDESPSRYAKVVAVGLFTPDGDFLCLDVRTCSGTTGDTLANDIFDIVRDFGGGDLWRQIDSIISDAGSTALKAGRLIQEKYRSNKKW